MSTRATPPTPVQAHGETYASVIAKRPAHALNDQRVRLVDDARGPSGHKFGGHVFHSALTGYVWSVVGESAVVDFGTTDTGESLRVLCNVDELRIATAQHLRIITVAQAEATRLCDQALAAMTRLRATTQQRARAERYQSNEFSRTSARTTRLLCNLMRPAPGQPCTCSHEELLEAIGIYCDAGVAEVRRRFDAVARAS